MPDDAQPANADPKAERCPRCVLVLPPKASRCPYCGQPIHSMRFLPFVIGIAGLMALVFAALVMYKMAANEEDANAPLTVDQNATQQQPLFPDPPPTNSNSHEPTKSDKKPPLNEH